MTVYNLAHIQYEMSNYGEAETCLDLAHNVVKNIQSPLKRFSTDDMSGILWNLTYRTKPTASHAA